MRLVVEHVFLELAHQSPLLCKIGLVQHLVVERDLRLVVELPVIRRVIRQDSAARRAAG